VESIRQLVLADCRLVCSVEDRVYVDRQGQGGVAALCGDAVVSHVDSACGLEDFAVESIRQLVRTNGGLVSAVEDRVYIDRQGQCGVAALRGDAVVRHVDCAGSLEDFAVESVRQLVRTNGGLVSAVEDRVYVYRQCQGGVAALRGDAVMRHVDSACGLEDLTVESIRQLVLADRRLVGSMQYGIDVDRQGQGGVAALRGDAVMRNVDGAGGLEDFAVESIRQLVLADRRLVSAVEDRVYVDRQGQGGVAALRGDSVMCHVDGAGSLEDLAVESVRQLVLADCRLVGSMQYGIYCQVKSHHTVAHLSIL